MAGLSLCPRFSTTARRGAMVRYAAAITLGRSVNVVFLSPHFPPNWFRFVVGLRNAGATTMGIADQPWETLRPELREALDEFRRVDDLNDHEQLVRALGTFISRRGLIDRIDSLNEHW